MSIIWKICLTIAWILCYKIFRVKFIFQPFSRQIKMYFSVSFLNVRCCQHHVSAGYSFYQENLKNGNGWKCKRYTLEVNLEDKNLNIQVYSIKISIMNFRKWRLQTKFVFHHAFKHLFVRLFILKSNKSQSSCLEKNKIVFFKQKKLSEMT